MTEPIEPSEPGVAVDTTVAELLAPLDDLADRPVGEHPAAYEAVHGRLTAVLAGEPHPA